MSGIERIFAGLLLAGAVAGVAAFAHSVDGGPEKSSVAPLVQPIPHGDSSTTVRIRALPGVPVPGSLSVGSVATAVRPSTTAPATPAARLRPLRLPAVARVMHQARKAAPAEHAAAPAPVHTTKRAPAPVAPVPPPVTSPVTPPAPAPAPAAPAPATSGPAAPAAQTQKAPAPLTPTPVAPSQRGHGNGKAKGHNKRDEVPPTAAVETLEPLAVEPAPTETATVPVVTVVQELAPAAPPLQGDDDGHGHGHGRGHGNDK